jgi:hypothetical protein
VTGSQVRRQISSDGGTNPEWHPRGGELFYRRGSAMMAVTIESDPTLSAGLPVKLFEGAFSDGQFSMAPDGRFLMRKFIRTEPISRLVYVQNWHEELARRVN